MVCLAENWDANIFCQERTQLFRLSGYLHDQVELTETGRGLTENTPRASHSPRARPAEKRAAAAASRNHQVAQALHLEPAASQASHRAPAANPRREVMQVGAISHAYTVLSVRFAFLHLSLADTIRHYTYLS